MDSTSYHLVSDEPLDRAFLAMESQRDPTDVFIDSSAGSARVSLRDGWFVDAEFGDLTGLDAISAVLRLRDGKYCIKTGTEPSRRSMSHRVSEIVKSNPPEAKAHDPREIVSLGPRVALTDKPQTTGGKTMRGWAPAPIDLVKRKESRPEALPPEAKQPEARRPENEKGPPGRYAAGSAQPTDTRYSSVPPPLLAEEHVSLPRSASRPQSNDNSRRRHPSSGRSGAALCQAGVPAEKPRETVDASELDDEVVRAARGQLRESEMPVPSTHLGKDALKQLDQLKDALASSPRLHLPFTALVEADAPTAHQVSSAPTSTLPPEVSGDFTLPSRGLPAQALQAPPPSDPADAEPVRTPDKPPSRGPPSDTGSQSLIAPVPGSVPHPSALPGGGDAQPLGGLPIVGRYQVLARLKRGGMGSVYLCRLSGSAGFRRLFAMKVLHSHLTERPGALDAFFHEAQVLGNLHHRNIVGIADVGSATDPYIVLEYVEGGSLAEIFRATRKIPRDPAVIVSVVLDALSGLGAAHAATDETGQPLALVHCDVTPHNLLVGIDGTCRLTDFGISRTGYIDAQEEVIQGKPGYLAPERIRRQRSDHRSDIFSMGVVLYAGLTGLEPFSAEDSDKTMKKILESRVTPPSQVGFHPPACLDAVCLKALATDPKERFQSSEEMSEQLRRIAMKEGLLVGPEEVASWLRRHLGPTLEARRIASMRGATSAEDQKNWATLPPPDVAQKPKEHPQEPLSSAENTGPLDPPPSSHGFDDRTETLANPQQASSRPKGATFVVYLLLTLAMAGLVWLVLQPGSLNSLLSGESAPHEERPEEQETSGQEQEPSEGESDPDKIVIPDIAPATERENE